MSVVRRTAAVAAVSAVVLVGIAAPASAHVTVQPGTAEKGSWSKVAFRVPNERDEAATTKLVVSLPQDHPIKFVSVRPVPGWKVSSDATAITWTGGKIAKGEFQEFEVSLGPLPTDVDELVFKADQTYSDGEVVHWDEPAKPDGTEPEHPAPVLALTEAKPIKDAAATPTVAKKVETGDDTARLLGGIGLAAGLIGLALGAAAFARSRKNA